MRSFSYDWCAAAQEANIMGNLCMCLFWCIGFFFFGLTQSRLMFPEGGYNTVSPHAAICMLFMKNKLGKRTN